MISKDKCRQIGTLVKPHGTRGSLLLRLKDIQAQDLLKMESVFVEIDGLLVPFFLNEFRPSSSESVIVTIDDILSENKAKFLIQRDVFVRPDRIRRKRKPVNDLPDLKGYEVNDEEKGYIGTAGEIEDIANNPLLHVTHGDKKYLIPLHQDIVLDIDDKNRVIRIKAPEGLFDL
jgi:16S rRNA processing protein RimM